jgi:CRP-like cAMP-binding protein
MVKEDLTQAIKNCSLFDCLSSDQIGLLASLTHRRNYHNGEYVIRHGDLGEDLFIIESGNVKTQVKGPDGRPRTINELGSGEYFGEIGLLTGGQRSADCIAMGPLSAVVLSKESYFRFLSHTTKVQQAATKTAVERIRASAGIEAIPVQDTVDHVLGKLMRYELRSLRASGVYEQSVSFNELLDFYESVKFLYPAKLKELKPRFSSIEATWNNLLDANDKVFKVIIRKEISGGQVVIGSSVCAFEYAPGTWQTQHLVSASRHGFTGTLLMLLALINWFGRNTEIDIVRFTYRPDNPGVKRLFGKMSQNLGSEISRSVVYDYALSTNIDELSNDRTNTNGYRIIPATDDIIHRVTQFYSSILNPLELKSLCLAEPKLQKTNERFRQFGLYRDRQIFFALVNNRIVGAVICNLASEGINFSFLENEITGLELDEDLSPAMQLAIFRSLICSAVRYYREHNRDYVVFMIRSNYKVLREAVGITSDKQYAVFTSLADISTTNRAGEACVQYYREHLVRK